MGVGVIAHFETATTATKAKKDKENRNEKTNKQKNEEQEASGKKHNRNTNVTYISQYRVRQQEKAQQCGKQRLEERSSHGEASKQQKIDHPIGGQKEEKKNEN